MPKQKQSGEPKQFSCYVEGMHCAACELLIEKKLLKQSGVKSVDASLKQGKVRIFMDAGQPDWNQLNQQFGHLGYTFTHKKPKRAELPLLAMTDGGVRLNARKAKALAKSLLWVCSLLIGFFLFEKLQLAQFVRVDSTSALPAFFLLGLVAGISSCAALIGGLLLSLTKQWNETYIDADHWQQKAQPHVLFHAGRLASFTILGGLLGLVGDVISLDNPAVFSFLTIAVSVWMLLLALQMLEVRWAYRLTPRLPRFITRYAADETHFRGRYMPFMTGAATFFLPCGFTLVAQGVALASGSLISGALVMGLFALGTLPMLAAISAGGLSLNRKPHLTARFNLAAGLLIVFFAFYNINAQMNVLGLPSLSDIRLGSQTGEQTVATISAEGTQELSFVARGFDYIPVGSTTIRAGVPTKMTIDNQGIAGCGAYMMARGLFDNYIPLKPGENVIEFTPQKGSYKVTCTMGMVPPVTVNVI